MATSTSILCATIANSGCSAVQATPSRTKINCKMKQLLENELDKLILWLDQFELSKSRKVLSRDFSDAVLLAEVLKRLYPKLVDLHNYPPRNSFHLKMDNWNTINRKVLRKLGLIQPPDMLANFCNAVPGAIEWLCFEIMTKYQTDKKNNATNNYEDDSSSDNTDIMNVNVEKKNGVGGVKSVVQKMVNYALYEKSQTTVYEQQQSIAILTQKIEHLDNLLKLKCTRIEDLLGQLARKTCRMKIESELGLNTNDGNNCVALESSRSTFN